MDPLVILLLVGLVVSAALILALLLQRSRFGERLERFAHEQKVAEARLMTKIDELSRGHFETNQQLGARLDAASAHLNRSMQQTAQTTSKGLATLNERLAVIDAAQSRLGEISGRLSSLNAVLADKQSRGLFGQAHMESIIRDSLPPTAYTFQPRLDDGRRPDCLISLPSSREKLVIDSKFPLEDFTALRRAQNAEEEEKSARRVRSTVMGHVDQIATRYLKNDETMEVALMFVPSESVYAELYERFDDLFQKAFRRRVLIVGPSLLMLAVQIMQSFVRDVKMRSEAKIIQREVLKIIEDVKRLDERAGKLQRHFGLAARDIDDLLISSGKVRSRSEKVVEVDMLGAQSPVAEPDSSAQAVLSEDLAVNAER